MTVDPARREKYRTAWSDYRARRKLLFLSFAGYIPWGLTVAGAQWLLGFRDTLVFVLLFLWMGFFVVAGIYFQFWKCPRCGNPFFTKYWYSNAFASKCLHCKLEKKEICAAVA